MENILDKQKVFGKIVNVRCCPICDAKVMLIYRNHGRFKIVCPKCKNNVFYRLSGQDYKFACAVCKFPVGKKSETKGRPNTWEEDVAEGIKIVPALGKLLERLNKTKGRLKK